MKEFVDVVVVAFLFPENEFVWLVQNDVGAIPTLVCVLACVGLAPSTE